MNGFLCDGQWDSFIRRGEPDGFFELEFEPGTGDITGTHIFLNEEEEVVEEFSVWGTCRHPTPQNPTHHIDLIEPRGDLAYRYFGVVVPAPNGKHRVPNGKRRTMQRLNLRARAFVEDDWIAEKVT